MKLMMSVILYFCDCEAGQCTEKLIRKNFIEEGKNPFKHPKKKISKVLEEIFPNLKKERPIKIF